ncbi:MAG: hypothetical protein NTZ05_02395 [Chloroflexi bacterium]|nr:hypothetical protein [Chloroflexota bacterium]
MKQNKKRWAPRWLVWAALAALAVIVAPLGQMATATPPDTGLPPVKQRIEDQYERERVEGLQRRAPKGPAARMATVSDDQFRPSGIIERGPAPFSTEDVTVRNQWQQQVDGVWVQVYAGALAENPAQGVVVVASEGAAAREAATDRYLAPRPSGALRIVAESGGRLTLEAADGKQLAFDLASRRFGAP